MEPWRPLMPQENFVEAIEDGKIVKVPENYAKREGLLIIRKAQNPEHKPAKKVNDQEERLSFDDFRKPLSWKTNQVFPELIENFHWEITKRRKYLNLTRKQLAEAIRERENTIKLIENGVLPKDDFIIINKIQSCLKINLRKDRQDISQPARKLLDEKKIGERLEKRKESEILGDDIELIEE